MLNPRNKSGFLKENQKNRLNFLWRRTQCSIHSSQFDIKNTVFKEHIKWI